MLFALAGLGPVASADERRPNILFIAIDDLNDWPAIMGERIAAPTPNIDRLARRGTLFRDAHCQFPLCGPSRASVLTGLRPTTLKIFDHLPDEELQRRAHDHGVPLLHEVFRTAGYHTMAVGKIAHNHVPTGSVDESGGREPFGPKPRPNFKWNQRGTSTDWGPWPERDEDTADYRAAQWSIERLRTPAEAPFLLMTGFLRPHVPWYVPAPWFERMGPAEQLPLPAYDPDDWSDIPPGAAIAREPQYPTTEWAIKHGEWDDIVQAYLACVAFVDQQVGEVLDALDRSPQAENTIVVLWSDNGYHLGEKGLFKKVTLWERSTHVPLIIAGPGLPAGQVCNQVVSLLDIYPTLLELAQLPVPAPLEGHSLVPLLYDATAPWTNRSVSTMGEDNHALITSSYRYIQYTDGGTELYDRHRDPDELHNLSNDPEFHDTVVRLAAELATILHR